MKTIDILCVGELLIDLMGHDKGATILDTQNYKRFLGGSPTNVAINASRLGLKTALVGSCGKDGLGDFIMNKLQEEQVITTFIHRNVNLPTSIILVSKSIDTPDFMAYRAADRMIPNNVITENLLNRSKIFHTTCFALSESPAREAILSGAELAHHLGLQLSIDINYSEKIWPNREEAQNVLKQFLKYDPLVKLSNDDCLRLFDEDKSDAEIFSYFHKLGVSRICLTKGKDGVTVSDLALGIIHQPAVKIDNIQDVTGAGDAFWTGFLYAHINNKSIETALTFAQNLASLKLQRVGKIPREIDLDNLFAIK